jgi:hypothetical protein
VITWWLVMSDRWDVFGSGETVFYGSAVLGAMELAAEILAVMLLI